MNRHAPIASCRVRAVVYSMDAHSDACGAIRIAGPLEAAGWSVEWAVVSEGGAFRFDVGAARDADLIIIQRHFPADFTFGALLSLAGLGIPMIYDSDDAFLSMPSTHPLRDFFRARAPYMRWMLKEADLVTVSTAPLRESLRRRTRRPVLVVPNLVQWELFHAPSAPRNGNFNLLIAGTPTHGNDWGMVETPLQQFLSARKGRVNAVFFGEVPPSLAGNPLVSQIPFEREYAKYAALLGRLNIHGALVPLQDNPFNRCKSNIKWLEYSTAGIPAAFSNVLPYSSCIRDGETGLLVDNSDSSWLEAMNRLVADPETPAMVENAQREIRCGHTTAARSADYADALGRAIGRAHRRSAMAAAGIAPRRLQCYAREVAQAAVRLADAHVMWRFRRGGR